jgi:hypothetical protein
MSAGHGQIPAGKQDVRVAMARFVTEWGAMSGYRSILAGSGIVVALVGGAAEARDSLGVYGGWGAFRDGTPHRCYAIAAPESGAGGNGRWKPFASVAHWPDAGIRGQLHIRLSTAVRGQSIKGGGAPLVLKIDGALFPLLAGGADAWAPSAAADAAIVAAMRSGHLMSVGANDYALKGAASAIDAAALGCARGR